MPDNAPDRTDSSAFVLRHDSGSGGKGVLVTADVAEVIDYLTRTLPTMRLGERIYLDPMSNGRPS